MRKLCMIVVLVIVLNMNAAEIVSAFDDENVIFSMDFENYDNSEVVDLGFDNIVGTTNYPRNIDAEHGVSFAVSTASVVRGYKELSAPVNSGVYYLSFDIYKEKVEGLTYIRMVNNNYTEYNTANADNMFEIFSANAEQMGLCRNTNGWTLESSAVSYDESTWYKIDLWIDFDNRQITFYQNGEKMGSTSLHELFTDLKGIWFIHESKGSTSMIAFDNILFAKVDLDYAKMLAEEGVTVPQELLNPVNIDISSSEIGNVFTDTAPPVLDVSYYNKDRSPIEFKAEYIVTDSSGVPVWNKNEIVTLQSGQESSVNVTPNISKYDIYTLYANLTFDDGSGQSANKQFSLVHVPTEGVKNNRYGMVMHTNKDGRTSVEQGIPVYAKIGSGFVREDFGWMDYEISSGNYGFTGSKKEYFDKWLQYLQTYNLTPLLVCGATNPNLGIPNADKVPRSEEGLDALEEMAYHLASEYKGIIEHFEFTNEPDFARQDEMSYEIFAKALQHFYMGIKRGNPDAYVLNGGTSRPNYGWIEGVLKAGGAGYCDAVAIHPYQGSASPESTEWVQMVMPVREMLRENGWQDLEVWVTEANTSSSTQYNTEEQQGFNLVRHYALVEAYDVADTFISYQFQTNDADPNDNEACFGTVRGWGVENAYGAKPAYLFAANYFACTEGTEFERIIQEENLYLLQYKKADGKSIFMMYADRGVEQISLRLGSDSGILYDKYGNQTEITSIEGTYTFVVSDAPVYFETAAQTFELCETPVISASSVLEGLLEDGTVSFTFMGCDNMELEVSAKENYEISYSDKTVNVQMLEVSEIFDYTERDGQLGKDILRDNITVTIKQENKVYAVFPLAVQYQQRRVGGEMSVRPYNDKNPERWVGEVTLWNNDSAMAVSGTLSVVTPEPLAETVAPVKIENLAPGEEETIQFNIPPQLLEESQLYSMVFESDDGEQTEIYLGVCDNSNFYSEPKATSIQAIKKTMGNTMIDGVIDRDEWEDYQITTFDKSEVTYGSSGLVIDGVVERETFGAEADYGGKDDFSGEFFAKWDENFLYAAAIVKDDVHYQKECPVRIYLDDCFYINAKNTTNQRHDTRIDMGLSETVDEPIMFTNWTPLFGQSNATVLNNEQYGNEIAIVRKNNVTIYEAKIPWSVLYYEPVEKYTNLQLTFSVRDYDGDRDKSTSYGGWFCLTAGK